MAEHNITNAKLSAQQIAEIKASKEPTHVLAARYGVKRTTIWRHRMDEVPGTSEREIRELARSKERARGVRRSREMDRRTRLRAEIAAITWHAA